MSTTPGRIDEEPVTAVSAQIEDQDSFDEELEDEDGEDEADDEYSSGVRSTIRAKWSMDVAATLTEAAELLRGHADYLLAMERDGWQLTEPVRDDYGFIRRPPTPETKATTS